MDHLSTKTSSTSRARFVDKNQGEKEGVDLRSEEEGRGQVGQRRVVLVPTESQDTPQSVQDREQPSSVAVTIPASSVRSRGQSWAVAW